MQVVKQVKFIKVNSLSPCHRFLANKWATHSRRRSGIMGDARFAFCPNWFCQKLPISNHLFSNFNPILSKFTHFIKFCPNL